MAVAVLQLADINVPDSSTNDQSNPGTPRNCEDVSKDMQGLLKDFGMDPPLPVRNLEAQISEPDYLKYITDAIGWDCTDFIEDPEFMDDLPGFM
jgi:hypothetical protein